MWIQKGNRIEIERHDVLFEECLRYLNRNQNELLHEVDIENKVIRKAVRCEKEIVLIQLEATDQHLLLSFPLRVPDSRSKAEIVHHVIDWMDLDRDLAPFYQLAKQDHILNHIVHGREGLRMIGVPDLFEAMAWSIMGQQVSLHVAYLLKKRLVERYGESVVCEGKEYWTFPEPGIIAKLTKEDLLSLKFTNRKAEYLLGVADIIATGQLKKTALQQMPLPVMEKSLIAIRGIGSWSANYVMMRCLRHPDAFPAADVGLHNALKKVIGSHSKPSLSEIMEWSEKWTDWRAYATFYLWMELAAE
ncbi:DNA-3-methyladenine glycosylase family protein [Fictibacillus terranigra]|uniref:DNA-3-methyladenine glycosylase II n=1 Tax=Fictibacillus terranigra TaxID=3058424 RepID=A0ABT8E8J0_9BACL|nr:DNA-3-methyladenine glycosylase [Fictibacillus sp. CENA-BCM004]MDN4074231.1 DNA-3-methyladenine glycosylase [Fictibacillus sp. CENA-BCM004]